MAIEMTVTSFSTEKLVDGGYIVIEGWSQRDPARMSIPRFATADIDAALAYIHKRLTNPSETNTNASC